MNKTISYLGIKPEIHLNTFVAKSADIIGKVKIEENASIWYQCVLRGDINSITIGTGTNIQDQSIIHVGENDRSTIGDYVTVGHSSIIHGCTIGNQVLIGMGACILNGAVIGDNCIVGARSLVTKNKVFEDGMLIVGSPAKAIRKLTTDEIESIKQSSMNYIQLAKEYSDKDNLEDSKI